MKKATSPGDPYIIARVRKYLEENVDKTFLDIGLMTKQLQDRYPEYGRFKTIKLRPLVEHAYRAVSKSYGLGSRPSSCSDTDGSDLEVMDDTVGTNVMSNMMNELYQKPKLNSAKPTKQSTAEAIDISSDDDSVGSNAIDKNGKNTDKEKRPGADTLRCVPSSKIVANAESASKSSSSSNSMNATDLTNAPLLGGARKRPDFSDSNELQHQPNKKPKTDKNDAPNEQTPGELQAQSRTAKVYRTPVENSSRAVPNGNPPVQHLLRHRKFKKEVIPRKVRDLTFQNIGGMEKTLKELCELLMHIKSPEIYFNLGLCPPRGFLLHGPSGSGKTHLAQAIAGQLNLPLIEIPATELIAGVSGESEERIRDVFEQALLFAPCVLFLDDIDAISSNRSMAQKDMEIRIVSQLLSCLDNLKLTEEGQSVLVIGATTRPDVLDPALRRVGRFDHEIALGIPSRKDRKDILTILCYGLAVDPKCDFDKIAELTPGYVGADLFALVSRAATITVKRECISQIRSMQMESQRNMTIVNLDDDADDEQVTAAKEKGAESKSEPEPKPKNDQEKDETNINGATDNSGGDGKTNVIERMEVDDAGNSKAIDSEKAIVVIVVDGKDETAANISDGDKCKVTTATAPDDTAETISATTADATGVTGTAVEADGTGPVDVNKSKEDATSEQSEPKKAVAAQNIQEPSLLELLNWLDNPLDDVTYSENLCITLSDFLEAVKVVQPSSKREGFITVPDVTWADVGSLQDIREELQLAVLAPVKFPEKLATLGLNAPSGVLLCGPPGCGKTLLAKAIANEAGINFISVKGPEMMNKYVGESERAVRACFQRARNSAPCVIFFDEFDSLCAKRNESNEASSGTRIVNQLLTEMDGVEDRKGVYVLAASNRPDIIDPAILRPGRLDTVLYVGLPKTQDRIEILKATTKNGTRPMLAADVDFADLAAKTDGYTGADLAGLMKQAAMLTLKDSISKPEITDLCINKERIEIALRSVRPSVSIEDRKMYEKLRLKYAAPRETSVSSDLYKERAQVKTAIANSELK